MKPRLLQFTFLTSVLVIGLVGKTAAVCGWTAFSQRIVGGKSSAPGRWPWQVSVVSGGIHLCGGSLISRSWVVTAAHCMRAARKHKRSNDRRPPDRRKWDEQFYVMLGLLRLTSANTSKVLLPVRNIIIHPKYGGDGTSGDLALLELESPVTFNSNVQPICLPYPDQKFPDGMMCWVTGWGNTAEGVTLAPPQTLQEVELPLINSTACDQMIKDANNIPFSTLLVQDDMICAGIPEGKKDGCQGDSGSPLACHNGDSWLLAGVVSWGDGCGRPGAPGVYTKVSSFSSWILENTDLAATSKRKINETTMSVNGSKRPSAVARRFAPKIIQSGANGAGQRPQGAATGVMLLILLIRTLDVV